MTTKQIQNYFVTPLCILGDIALIAFILIKYYKIDIGFWLYSLLIIWIVTLAVSCLILQKHRRRSEKG